MKSAKSGLNNEVNGQTAKTDAVLEFMTCPTCGFEIRLWSGSALTTCLFCGHRPFKKEMTLH